MKLEKIFKNDDYKIVKYDGELVMVSDLFVFEPTTGENVSPVVKVKVTSLRHSHFEKPSFHLMDTESALDNVFTKLSKDEKALVINNFIQNTLPLKTFDKRTIDKIRFAISDLFQTLI